MSLLNKLKHASGLGLNQDESYRRAYEKGVLLEDFSAAVELFQKAAVKFEQTGNREMQIRALANSYLYAFLASKKLTIVSQVAPLLDQLQEIEEFGSQTEFVPAAELAAEIRAREIENQAFAEASDAGRVQLHYHASEAFQGLLKTTLRTYKIVPTADGKGTAQERFFLHRGWHTYYRAVQAQWSDPAQAGDLYSEALAAFRQANLETERQRTESLREQMRKKRTCWMCHREMQGEQVHFTYTRSVLTAYCRSVIRQRGEWDATVQPDGEAVTTCVTCLTLTRNLADVVAQQRTAELRNQVQAELKQMSVALQNLTRRMESLEITRR